MAEVADRVVAEVAKVVAVVGAVAMAAVVAVATAAVGLRHQSRSHQAATVMGAAVAAVVVAKAVTVVAMEACDHSLGRWLEAAPVSPLLCTGRHRTRFDPTKANT